MPDGYMNPEDAHPTPGDSEATAPRARDQSTIQFPYMDLDTAIDVARIMRDRGGNSPFTKDQLAAAMGHSATSGALAAKIHAARMFGVMDNPTPGRFRVSQLGFDVIDPDPGRVHLAKMEAFLRIPLYIRRCMRSTEGGSTPASKWAMPAKCWSPQSSP